MLSEHSRIRKGGTECEQGAQLLRIVLIISTIPGRAAHGTQRRNITLLVQSAGLPYTQTKEKQVSSAA